MSAIKSKHTLPEKLFRAILRKSGVKYRLHYGKEKIDIAIPSKKTAIFIDGCFWHNCPKHGHIPKSNRKYWVPKLKRNVERDKEKTMRLKKVGWRVIRIWEHQIDTFIKKKIIW